MVDAIVWNCRGIGNNSTLNHLKGMICKFKIPFVALLEPMLAGDKASRIMTKLKMDQVWCNSVADNKIWTFWDNSISVSHYNDTSQVSTFRVKNGLNEEVYLSVVYAACDRTPRRDLWVDMLNLSSGIDQPWLIGGDWNCVTATSECIGGGAFDFPSADDFVDFLQFNGLGEVNHVGNVFSWCNNQQGVSRIYKRLDRMVANADFLDNFQFTVTYLPRVHSDHAPMLIKSSEEWKGGPTPFRFQAMWTLHANFQDFIKEKWNFNTGFPPMQNLTFKLKGLKQHLKS